jgi:hypothetical protein
MVDSIAARYSARLLDQQSQQVDVFDRVTSFEINNKLNGVGSHTVIFDDLSDDRKNAFVVDGQLQIYREVPGVGLDRYVEFEGLHRASTEKIDKNKRDIFTSSGVGFNSFLERTNIAYREGTIRADKYDVAETVMKEYVEENCGPSATVANGRIIDGVLPYFTVQRDARQGPLWSGSRAFENLLDSLQAISSYAGVDFDVIRLGYPGFVFLTYHLLKGADRTTIGLDSATGKNAAGNEPVTLSVSLGNLQEATYENNRLEEANVCIVLGDGDGSTREILARDDETEANRSPWNRMEVARPSQPAFIPGLSEEAAAELKTFSMQQTGDEVLEELRAKEDFTFSPLQQPSSLYGLHYFLGDRITVQFRDFTAHKRIVGVQIRVQRDKETISLDVASFTTGTQ